MHFLAEEGKALSFLCWLTRAPGDAASRSCIAEVTTITHANLRDRLYRVIQGDA
jgi:hypothetical protein